MHQNRPPAPPVDRIAALHDRITALHRMVERLVDPIEESLAEISSAGRWRKILSYCLGFALLLQVSISIYAATVAAEQQRATAQLAHLVQRLEAQVSDKIVQQARAQDLTEDQIDKLIEITRAASKSQAARDKLDKIKSLREESHLEGYGTQGPLR